MPATFEQLFTMIFGDFQKSTLDVSLFCAIMASICPSIVQLRVIALLPLLLIRYTSAP